MLCVFIFILSMCYALVLVFAISTFFFSISIIMVFPTVCLDEIIVCVFFCCCYNLLHFFCFDFPSFRVRPDTRGSITEIIIKKQESN